MKYERLVVVVRGHFSGDELDRYTLENMALEDVLGWIGDEFGGADEFGSVYDFEVFDSHGEPVAEFVL